jgi:hypothetical protein
MIDLNALPRNAEHTLVTPDILKHPTEFDTDRQAQILTEVVQYIQISGVCFV